MESTINSFTGKNAFLSNFFPSEIAYEGIIYPTVEHAFQAAKTHDRLVRRHIADLPTPGEAKRAGRQVVLREDWEQVKHIVMWNCLYEKFTDPDLNEALWATRPRTLIEGNTWGDRYWGQVNGEGKNVLGILLMCLRDTILDKQYGRFPIQHYGPC